MLLNFISGFNKLICSPAMSNISPGLNDRFASIEINRPTPLRQNPPKSPKKSYPQSLYPQNHSGSTPSRAPVLSTARRAESRTALASKSQASTPLAQKRQLNRSNNDQSMVTPGYSARSSEDRAARAPDLSGCTFMQPTSSSRKKQSGRERIGPQSRAVSHSEIYNKRPHHTFASRKRQLSKSGQPADITNKPIEPSFKTSFGDKPTMFCNASPSRHVSTAYTSKAKEDVYTRLYNSSVKLKLKLDKTRTPSGNKTVGFAPSLPTLTASYSLSSLAQGSLTNRPLSLHRIYKTIYTKQPLLFDESSSLQMDWVPNEPILTQEFMDREGTSLTVYERGEIMRKPQLYYIPLRSGMAGSCVNISSFKNNYGFDDSDGNYVIRPNDHIEFRYEIIRALGTGSFGNVVLCTDHKYSNQNRKRLVAIKIIKNELDWSLQAVSEIKMLKHLSQRDTFNHYLLNYCDHFHFRGHMCIVTEVLSINLYTLLEVLDFLGVSLGILKSIATKILRGLQSIHELKVIHCDIKPENIMLRLPGDFDPSSTSEPDLEVRIIDFGSSCLETETSFSYIQSRFYRAPEVILGAKYSSKIDIWSFGCVIAELFSGTPLLPGKTELEQIGLILELFGAPPSSFIVSERKKLMQLIKVNGAKNLNDPLVADPMVFNGRNKLPIDERKIKKTLLYSLFNLEGKVNLQFLNLQLQSSGNRPVTSSAPSPFKRNVKLSSKSLDVELRLHSANESRQHLAQFSQFLFSIFQWDPRERASPEQLLASQFLA